MVLVIDYSVYFPYYHLVAIYYLQRYSSNSESFTISQCFPSSSCALSSLLLAIAQCLPSNIVNAWLDKLIICSYVALIYYIHTDGYFDYLSTIVTTVVNPSCSRPPEGVLGTTPPTNFHICLRKCLLV